MFSLGIVGYGSWRSFPLFTTESRRKLKNYKKYGRLRNPQLSPFPFQISGVTQDELHRNLPASVGLLITSSAELFI